MLKRYLFILFLFFGVTCVFPQGMNDLLNPNGITADVVCSVLKDSFFEAEVNNGVVVVRVKGVVSIITVNSNDKLISFYISWTLSDRPIGDKRRQMLIDLSNEWATKRVFTRAYVGGNERSIVLDYTISYGAGITSNQIVNTFNEFTRSVGLFTYENGKAIQDTMLLDLESSLEPSDKSVFAYIQYVLNPTMEEVGNSIRLENDETIIIHKPNMQYIMVDKTTGVTTTGMRGFETNVKDFSQGTVYYLEGDEMSIPDFLEKSDYKSKFQMVVVPVLCDGKTLTVVTFSITEIKK